MDFLWPCGQSQKGVGGARVFALNHCSIAKWSRVAKWVNIILDISLLAWSCMFRDHWMIICEWNCQNGKGMWKWNSKINNECKMTWMEQQTKIIKRKRKEGNANMNWLTDPWKMNLKNGIRVVNLKCLLGC